MPGDAFVEDDHDFAVSRDIEEDARLLLSEARGAEMLAPPYSPPWGGHRFFVRDPDGYLVEVEQPA